MTYKNIKIPKKGNKISYKNGKLDVPSNPDKVKALEAAGFGADDIATLGKFSEQLTIIEREFSDFSGKFWILKFSIFLIIFLKFPFTLYFG